MFAKDVVLIVITKRYGYKNRDIRKDSLYEVILRVLV